MDQVNINAIQDHNYLACENALKRGMLYGTRSKVPT